MITGIFAVSGSGVVPHLDNQPIVVSPTDVTVLLHNTGPNEFRVNVDGVGKIVLAGMNTVVTGKEMVVQQTAGASTFATGSFEVTT